MSPLRGVGFGLVPDRNYGFTVPFMRGLASSGVAHACITPGSRSTPLALALADEPAITHWLHHDERSSAFFALGIAKATGSPALAVCTSGTAAAEFLPAVVEARHGRVPLLVITADRPTDLVGVGAPQTIEQRRLYGSAAKWSLDLEPPLPGEAAPGFATSLAARMVTAALEVPAGPVHLNIRFREPLVPVGEIAADLPPTPRVLPSRHRPEEEAVARVAGLLAGRRGVLLCGPQDDPNLPKAAAALAAAADLPLIADPLSQARTGSHDRSRVIAVADHLARSGWLERAAPEVVVRVGGLPTSRPIWQWLAAHPEIPQVLVDPAGWRDPTATASLVVRADPALTLEAVAALGPPPAPSQWMEGWKEAAGRVAAAIEGVLASAAFPNEPEVVGALGAALPAGALLWAASSMPVRDLDAFFPVRAEPVRFNANRGASGIDGFLSSGLGAAAASGLPTYLLAGDLSALHDLTALGTAARLAIPVTMVVVHNDGGGIFHLLPQAGLAEHFERLFGTPHGTDFVAAAHLFGIGGERVSARPALEAALAEPPAEPRLLEVRTDRDANAALHRAVWEAATEALAGR